MVSLIDVMPYLLKHDFQSLMRNTIFLISLVSFCIPVIARPNHLTNEIAFYIDTYGQALETDQQVKRAHQVFERVVAVADKSNKRNPELVIINYHKGPWAIALPDGHIVLSKKAVSLCHQWPRSRKIDACLAFIIGHELAHLAHDDFWHHELYQFIDQNKTTTEAIHHSEARERELKADDTGFIYAALSGFPVETLLVSESGNTDFFTLWIQQGGGYQGSSTHPSTTTRLKLLQQRLTRLQEKIGFFKFGVRLSHFDYCDDAVYFFHEFQKIYPGREVLNNLGFCYLQMARQAMGSLAYFYWMPSVLDGETRVVSYRQRNEITLKSLRQGFNQQAVGFLEEAHGYFKRAVEADPDYLAARLNLATTLLYLGRPHGAKDRLMDVKTSAPDDLMGKGLAVLALYEQSDVDIDLWPRAVDKLRKLTEQSDASPSLIFNLARLLDVRPRPAEARIYWNRLAHKVDQLPDSIHTIVCQKQITMPVKSCTHNTNNTLTIVDRLPWRWPLPDYNGKPMTVAERKKLESWQRIEFSWSTGRLNGAIYQNRESLAEVLEMDRFIQMQVLKQPQINVSIETLQTYCYKPLRQRQLASGTVWSCGNWAALTHNNEIQELWLIVK